MAIKPALFSKVLADRGLEEAAELTAEIGYDGFEPMCRDPHLGVDRTTDEIAALGERLDELDLDVPCLATYTGSYAGKSPSECEDELTDLERYLEFATLLDCDLVRHNPGGPAVRDATTDDIESVASLYSRAADRAAAHDISLVIEIHARWLSETIDSTHRLLAAIDRENVGVIHDAGNMYLVGENYGKDSVDRLGEALRHVHVKDEQRIDDDDAPGAFQVQTDDGLETFRPRRLGEGSVDHAPLFAALADTGYDGFVTAECHVPQSEPGDDIAIARHELEQLGALIDDAT